MSKAREERLTHRQPDADGVPKAQRTKEETYTGGNPGTAGILGPDGAPAGAGTTGGDYSNTETETEWAVNAVREEIERAPGDVEQLGLAVLLDSDSVSAADQARWTQTITAAAGIDRRRGDVISVNRVSFDQSAREAAEAQVKSAESAKSQDFLLNLVRYLVTFLIVGVVLFLAWRSVKRSGVMPGPVRVPLDLRELEAGDLVGGRLDTAYDRTQLNPSAKRMSLDVAPSEAELELNQLIERQPDEVAQTLRSWLADRRS
jgi:flagellar M-ring protein FliF